MRCEYAHTDASYVLGALSPADRTEYERHLATCPECRDAVAEVAVLPGLLARLDAITAEELHYGAMSGRTGLDGVAFPADFDRPHHAGTPRGDRPGRARGPRAGRPGAAAGSRDAAAADGGGEEALRARLAGEASADESDLRDLDHDAEVHPDEAHLPDTAYPAEAAHLANPAHPAYVADRAHLANTGHPRNPAHRGGAARAQPAAGFRAAPRPIARPGEPRRPSRPAGRGRRSRLRYVLGGLLAVGLAAGAGLATWPTPLTSTLTAFGVRATPGPNRPATLSPDTPRLVPMVPVSREVPLSAEIALSRHGYGTKIRMTCRYADRGVNPPTWTVSLLAYGRDGVREQVGSWVAEPGGQVPFEGITRFAGDQLTRVEVVRADTGETLITHQVR